MATDAGIVYNALDLTFSNTLGLKFKDVAFHGNQPIVARDKVVTGYSSALVKTGTVTLGAIPLKLAVHGGTVFSFCSGGSRGIFEVQTALSALGQPNPDAPIDPNGLAYTPDSIFQGADGILYLLSRSHRAIFRGSVAQKKYLSSIPLPAASWPGLRGRIPFCLRRRRHLADLFHLQTRREPGFPIAMKRVFA